MGRKGSSWGHIARLFQSVDDQWFKDCVHSGLSSGEGLIWCIRDAIEKTEPVRENKRVIDYQQVKVDPGIEDKRALILESEFASTLRVMGRDGNTLSPVIRNAFDGKDLETLTKNSPARASNPHVSIIGHVTKNELLRYLDNTECGNGFANRFLWVCAKRSKILPEGGRIHEVDFAPLVNQLKEAVDFAGAVGELERDEEARVLWCKVYPELSEGKLGLFGSVTARAEALTMRLACLFALIDQSRSIRIEHLTAALSVWEYCEQSARYIFGDSLGDSDADLIKRTLDENPEGLARTDISNLFGRNKSASQIQRILDLLVRNGSAYSAMEEAGSGRPTERWFSMRHGTNLTK